MIKTMQCRRANVICVRLHTRKLTRDVPDIRFRLAGYPAVFFYPVPAEMVPGTGYLYRIVLGRFRQLVDAADRRHIVNSDFIA